MLLFSLIINYFYTLSSINLSLCWTRYKCMEISCTY